MKAQLSALGVRVRSVVCQHGDIPAMLARRGCELDFVELVSDPDFSVCKDYVAKGMQLIVLFARDSFSICGCMSVRGAIWATRVRSRGNRPPPRVEGACELCLQSGGALSFSNVSPAALLAVGGLAPGPDGATHGHAPADGHARAGPGFASR